MDYLKIQGPAHLSGKVKIQGAKNAALPLLALSIIARGKFTLTNLPDVADIATFLKLLGELGATYDKKAANEVVIDTKSITHQKATYDIVRTMRASILVLGPLLARFGYCEVSLPGGCAIGARPINLHIKALEAMGANITIEEGYIRAVAEDGLVGANITFDKITVTGSENAILAAALAKGTTHLYNVAKEPEVVQLCEELAKAGVMIKGIGTSMLEISGSEGELLEFAPIRVIPDRIEAGTYLCMGAITNDEISVEDICSHHLSAIIDKLEEIGFVLSVNETSITLHRAKELAPFSLTTGEYPAFPTDMQAQFMALATQCNGTSSIEEKLFENRLMHVSELQRLNANITTSGNTALIKGKSELVGTDVMATDLRASSALIIAALIARGESRVHRIYHLDRGYERLVEKLRGLGVEVSRERE